MQSLRSTANTAITSSGSQQISLISNGVGSIIQLGFSCQENSLSFLQKLPYFCTATADDPALTIPYARDFHYRFVQLWDLPLNHGPKVLLQFNVVSFELLMIFPLVSSNKVLVFLHCFTTPRQKEGKKYTIDIIYFCSTPSFCVR